MARITERTLTDLLAQRHSGDLFIPQCKTGPTYNSAPARIDAWALRRSYTRPRAWAYEVKVSRSDFVRDDKWQAYLPYCHEFYFVAPPGIIEKSELPEQAGLVVCSRNATRLYTKVKATYRPIEIPSELLFYVLFSRVKVSRFEDDGRRETAEFWRDWLAGKQELKLLGHHVGKALQVRLREEIDKRDAKQRQQEKNLETFAELQKCLASMGFDNAMPPHEWSLRERIKEIRAGIPRNLAHAMNTVERGLKDLRRVLGDGDGDGEDEPSDDFI